MISSGNKEDKNPNGGSIIGRQQNDRQEKKTVFFSIDIVSLSHGIVEYEVVWRTRSKALLADNKENHDASRNMAIEIK